MSDRQKILEHFESQKDTWQKKAAEGIEKYRKGDATFKVVDKNGNTLPNVKVKVSQSGHEFRFGANIFMLDELETPEKNEIYKKTFPEFFNMATLPFYWNSIEPVKGSPRYHIGCEKMYRRPPIDLCIDFCREHNIEPREHALAYEQWFPEWLKGASTEEVKTELERRYREVSELYADKIPTIEVTNEMFWAKGSTDFFTDPDYVNFCFKLARKYFPNNILCINEATEFIWKEAEDSNGKYYDYVKENIEKGAPIDAIGLQYHMFYRAEHEYGATRRTYDPENLYRTLDRFGAFGKDIHLTEITIPAYTDSPEDEELQAQIVENLYTIWFSHPKMTQIVYWNIVDGYAHVWGADPVKIRETQGNMAIGENYFRGGLLRFDMSPKPAFNRLKHLIKELWHTDESLVTSADGMASLRAFYGSYDIEIETQNGEKITKTVDISSKKENNFVFEV